MSAPPAGPDARYAWMFPVRLGCAGEYIARHRDMGPEMRDFLTRAGYRDYSIFMKDGRVFGTFACDDIDRLLKLQASDPVAQAWRQQMARLVENDPDPATGALLMLTPVFRHP